LSLGSEGKTYMTAAGTTRNSVPLFFYFLFVSLFAQFYNVRDEERMQK